MEKFANLVICFNSIQARCQEDNLLVFPLQIFMCLHYDPETFSLLILISLTFWGKIWGSSLRSKLQAQTLDKLLKNCTWRGLVHKFTIPQTFTYHGTFSPCFMFLAHQYNEGDFLQRELYMEGPPTAFERPKKTQSKWCADSSPSGQFPD